MKNKVILVIIALLVIAVGVYAFARPHPTAPVSPVPVVPSQPVQPPATSTQPWQSSQGPRVITQADFSATIPVTVGTPVTVKLSSNQQWNISWSDPSLLTPIETFAATPGVQGMYTAAAAGTTTLTAAGSPICAAGQACPQYVIEFTTTLVITP